MGSVVGAVFVILIILSGFVFYQIALLTMNNYNRVTDEMDQAEWKRSNEELTILSVEVTDSNNFNITVKNTGSVQSVLIWLGIFEQSNSVEDQPFVSVNFPIAIGEIESIISATQISPGDGYNIRLVTELGNVYDCSISESVQGELSLVLVAVPATVYVNNEITIFLSATNNNPYGSIVNNINILLIEENGKTSALTPSSSQTITSLSFGASKFFSWKCTAQNIGMAKFKASYEGGFVIATVEIKEAATEPNGQGQVTITGSAATQKYSPSQWTTLGETTHLSGTIADLSASDNNKVSFESYYTGTEDTINKYVTSNNSNVDGIENIGFMNNFEGMQSEPNGNYATLTENLTVSPAYTFGNSNDGISPVEITWGQIRGGNFTSGSTATAVNSISFYGEGKTGNAQAKAVILDKSGNILPNGISKPSPIPGRLEWHTLTFDINNRPAITPNTPYLLMIIAGGKIDVYYSSSVGGMGIYENDNNNYNVPTDLSGWFSNGHQYSINATTSEVEGYNLDYEVQWTDLNTSPDSNELAIYLMGQPGSEGEGLAVDVWTGSTWQPVLTNLPINEWSNTSITPYLTSPTFTIRFRDVTPYDATMDSWDIKTALIRQTGQIDQYTCEVEFSGTSNINTSYSTAWNFETYFDINNANVTIQFYNYEVESYSVSGEGYSSFFSTTGVDSLESYTFTSSFEDFIDESGNWKVKITAVKETSEQFTIEVDWIEINSTYESLGESIAYGVFQDYTIKVTDGTGNPIPYAYMSIYVNGTNITLKNTDTNLEINNPAWVQLDVNSEYRLKLQSNSNQAETFVILVSVGTTVGQKTVTQEAQ